MSPLVKYVFRNLIGRPLISVLVILCMAVVGATMSGVLAIGLGLRDTFNAKGHDEWVAVHAPGAIVEKDSGVDRARLTAITAAPEVKRASPEVIVGEMILTNGQVDVIALRGLEPDGFDLHRVRILEGRMPRRGEPEFIIGDALQAHRPEIKVGSVVKMLNQKFTCVGVFSADGFLSGEAWTTRATFLSNPLVDGLSVVYLETGSVGDAQRLSARMTATRSLGVEAEPDSTYRAKGIKVFGQLITGVTLVFVLVVTGAMLAAASLISVFQQRRLSELCVMRSMGFRPFSIAMLILYETELLVLFGGTIGIAAMWYGLRDYTVYTTSPGLSSVTFRAPLVPVQMAIAAAAIFLIGIVGAILPIVRMMGTPITRGLREE